MQKHFITLIIAIQLLFVTKIYSQNVALNTTGNNADTSAMLDISSTNKGLLMPRMSTAQVTAIPLPATGLIVFNTSINAFQVNIGTAAIPNWQTIGTTTNTLSSSGNTVTSIVNGVTATASAVNTVLNNSSANTLTTTVNGVAATGVNIVNSNTLNSSANVLTSTINGIAASGVNIINSNALGLSGQSLTSTVNGVASTALNLAGIDSSIYKTDGTLRAARTVTMGANNLTFNSSTGNLIFNPSSTGKIIIGAYTLPSADGLANQVLSTNGSGTVSWASAASGSGWGLTGNAGTSSSTNYIGTSDNNDLVFKRYATLAGSLTADNVSFGVSSYISGSNNVALGYSAQVQTSNGVAIGRGTYVSSQYAIAMGDGAQAQGSSNVSVGKSTYTSSTDAIAIGNSAQAQGTSNISIGKSSYSSSSDAIAIGDGAQAQGQNTTVIGTGIYNGTNNTVAIGNSSVTSFLMNGASAGGSKAIVVGTSSSNGNGAYLTTGGTWTNASDRNLKDGFTNLDEASVLNKISELDITRWKYKGTNEYHIGPMAQDFYKAFELGNDDKHISTIDPSGVALVCIKALIQQNAMLEKRLDKQEAIIKQLQK